MQILSGFNKSSISLKLLSALFLGTWLLAIIVPPAALAASTAKVDGNISQYLQLLHSEFNTGKVPLVNNIMNLSKEDAQKFWPIYRAYENEVGKLSIKRVELMVEFVQSHRDGTFSDAKAKYVAARYFEAQRARLDLLDKFHRKIEKALSSVQAARFLQIENQINIFIDMTIASEMPMVGESVK
jgi:hypothetical protein